MQLLQVVTLTFKYDEQYRVDISINKGILEAWLYRQDIGVKSFVIGMSASDTGYDEFIKIVENTIREDKCIELYEDEYVID
jgi:hypothetical protein